MNILIIANARRKGGLSGGDNIYLNFAKHWPATVRCQDMINIDFKPFIFCYIYRIYLGIIKALQDNTMWDIVYSASDFWMDSLPGFVYKLKGRKWVAGFYLYAPKKNIAYWLTQKLIYWLIKWKADLVFITNDSMKFGFEDKKTVSVNGGVDLSLAGIDKRPRIYDAVFCGRIHPTKGIDELMQIWKLVRNKKPDATLAIIGDGDLGKEYIQRQIPDNDDLGITLFGYMGNGRFNIYKSSKVVLYPTPERYSHFSMAPVEAMACGCPLIAFDISVMKFINPKGAILVKSVEKFVQAILDYAWLQKLEDTKNGVTAIVNNEYYDASIRAARWAVEWGWGWKQRAYEVYENMTKGIKK